METNQTLHITTVVNGFVVDIDGDPLKTRVFQKENADEMFEQLAHVLGVHQQIYQSSTGGSEQQTPVPFHITDPDI